MTAIWDFVTGLFGTLTHLLTLLTPIFILVSGIVSLFFGRKLFWVFVAAVGFLLGLYLFEYVGPVLPEYVAPYKELARLALALATAGVALIVQRAGTILAGAFAVGLLGWWLAGRLDLADWSQWSVAAVSGLFGAILLYLAIDWMLLVLTALVGGFIALTGMDQLEGLPANSGPWLYIVLVAAGLIYQQRELMQDTRLRAAAPAPSPRRVRLPLLPRRKSAKLDESESAAATVVAAVEPARPAPVTVPAAPASAPAPIPAPQPQGVPASGLVRFGPEIFAPSRPAAPAPQAVEPVAVAMTRPGPSRIASLRRRLSALWMPAPRMPALRMPRFTLRNPFRRRAPAAGAALPESQLVPLEPLSSTDGYAAYAPPQTYASPAPRGSAPQPMAHTVYG
jgi:hypothetical protein